MLQEDSRSFNDKYVRMGIAQVTTANECELNFMCDIGVGAFSKRLSKSCGYIKASATSSTTQPQLKCNRTESDVEDQLMFFCVQFLECGFSISSSQTYVTLHHTELFFVWQHSRRYISENLQINSHNIFAMRKFSWSFFPDTKSSRTKETEGDFQNPASRGSATQIQRFICDAEIPQLTAWTPFKCMEFITQTYLNCCATLDLCDVWQFTVHDRYQLSFPVSIFIINYI